MRPNEPCRCCKFEGFCHLAPYINKQAVDAWIMDEPFECEDFIPYIFFEED